MESDDKSGIISRQATEEFGLAGVVDALVAGNPFLSNPFRVDGYSAVNILVQALGSVTFDVYVLQAETVDGPFVQTDLLSSSATIAPPDMVTAYQMVQDRILPHGGFIRFYLVPAAVLASPRVFISGLPVT